MHDTQRNACLNWTSRPGLSWCTADPYSCRDILRGVGWWRPSHCSRRWSRHSWLESCPKATI